MKRVDTWEMVAAVAAHAMREYVYEDGVTRMPAIGAFRVAQTLDKLARNATKLHALYEDMCNGTIRGTEAIIDMSEAYELAGCVEEECEALGKSIHVVVTTQRDPRGPSVKIWADKEDGRMLGCF